MTRIYLLGLYRVRIVILFNNAVKFIEINIES